MPRQAKYGLLLLAVVLTLAVWLLWLRGGGTWSGEAPKWGHGPLKVSERAYYLSHIDTTLAAARDPDLQAAGSAYVCLVIDAAKKQMWVESDGRVIQEYHADLPPGMDWRLCLSTPNETKELPSLGRFRLPANRMKRTFLPEQISLVGTRGKKESMWFSLRYDGTDQYYGPAPWSLQSIQWQSSPQSVVSAGSGESIIVSDADYEKAKAQFTAGEPAATEPPELAESKAAWARAETRLYQELERQLSIKGLRLYNVEIKHGPAYATAFGQYTARYRGLHSLVRGAPPVGQAWLKVDHLGADVWYARTAQNPLQPRPVKPYLELEFLLSVGHSVGKREAEAFLTRGREKQQIDTLPSSKWRAELTNVAAVELVGICRNVGGYPQWWGPDGTPLEYYTLSDQGELPPPSPAGHITCQIAWRIQTPQGIGLATQISLEGSSGVYYRHIHDRYANPLPGALQAGVYTFDTSQEKATLRVGVRTTSGEYAWATFKDISLIRGRDQGFAVVDGPVGK